MKICGKCGAQQSDARVFCIDCGERLGHSISNMQSEKIKAETEKKLNKMCRKTDPFYISILDRVIGYLSIIGILIALAYMILYRHRLEYATESIFTILCFICCSLSALLPKTLWALEKLGLSFTIYRADEAEPSYFYLVMRKISLYGCFIIAVIGLASTITHLTHFPI